jgi:Fe-S cluster assembly protein SufD
MSATTTPSHEPEMVLASYQEQYKHLEANLNGLTGSFFHEHRRAAMEAFSQRGFPTRRDEEWKYTPTSSLTRQPLKTAAGQLSQAESFLSDLQANRLVFRNGHFRPDESVILDKGSFSLGSLQQAIKQEPDQVASWLDARQRPDWTPFALLNSAMYTDGAWIRLQPGAALEHPVLILDLCDELAPDEVVYPRHLIVAERDSAARIIHLQGIPGHSQARYRAFGVTEVFAERGANVQLEQVQAGGANYELIQTTDARLGEGSELTVRTFCLGGSLIRNDMRMMLAGEHATGHLDGIYHVCGDELADNHLVVDHAVPQGLSNQRYRGIAEERGTAVFNGKIFVRPKAQKTNAYQSNKNLLLSPTATVNTKPQLEIFADDVRCSHGATSGQLDAESLFYLMARGIPESKARAMLLEAFAAEITAALPADSLRDLLSELLHQRLVRNPTDQEDPLITD